MKAFAKKPSSKDTLTRRRSGIKDAPTPRITTIPISLTGYTFLQPKLLCSCDGGCPRCAPLIQPKLKVGQPNDRYEQEADRVTEQVMRMPEPEEEELIQTKPLAEQITPLVQRQEEEEEEEEEEEPIQTKLLSTEHSILQRQVEPEEEEEEELLQTKELTGPTPKVTPKLESRIQTLRRGGQPLPESIRSFFEPRFGHDLSQVRVYSDARAAEAARVLKAQAFTVGRDVVFGASQYAPETTAGRRLLAHELVHTIQQMGLGVTGVESHTLIQRTIGDGHDLRSSRYRDDLVLQACYDNERLLHIGHRGEAVKKVQETLVAVGFKLPLSTKADGELDGIFGPETKATVQDYQMTADLAVDGIVGPETIGHMDKLPTCSGESEYEDAAAFTAGPKKGTQPKLCIAPGGQGKQNHRTKIRQVTVTKHGSAPYDFEPKRGGGTDLEYHFGYVFKSRPGRITPLPTWYANLRFLVTVKVDGNVDNVEEYKQTICASWSTGKSKCEDETSSALKQRPLFDQNWVKVAGDKVMWQDAPGMTTDGNKTWDDLPFWFGGQFTQSAVGEDNIEVGVKWTVYYEVDEHGKWKRQYDELPVSASHPCP